MGVRTSKAFSTLANLMMACCTSNSTKYSIKASRPDRVFDGNMIGQQRPCCEKGCH